MEYEWLIPSLLVGACCPSYSSPLMGEDGGGGESCHSRESGNPEEAVILSESEESHGGQFLIELIIAMAIFAIAMVAMASLNVGGIRLFKTARIETLIQGNASDLARGMINGIPGGSHGLLGAKSIQTGDDADIVFVDKNDETIRYYLTADTIYKTVDGGSDKRFFDFNDAVNIESIDFRYYNRSDAQLSTPAANPSEITKVKIVATVKGKNDNDPEVTLTTSVKPRNLF